ncbi:AAA family ATPase [Timonella senegalensis]|uniref:AAA family ATPase n=1 Tax=Timonella senegalensis TaxID=1465825 RepID=UPI000316337B|nr:ATP-binding protein [Timonella senegalensis]
MGVIFMCGPAGSGKSFVARQYEELGCVRLSFDTEAWAQGYREMPLAQNVHQQIERLLRRRLIELVRAGHDVVLDFSFWSQEMRDEYRGILRPLGVTPTVVYLRTSRAVALERVRSRSQSHGDDFVLLDSVAQRYFDNFEVPTALEGPLVTLDGESREPVALPIF